LRGKVHEGRPNFFVAGKAQSRGGGRIGKGIRVNHLEPAIDGTASSEIEEKEGGRETGVKEGRTLKGKKVEKTGGYLKPAANDL